MNRTVEADLKSLMAYFGESTTSGESPEGPKPEDFFSLIVSFSSSLRVSSAVYLGLLFVLCGL